jgi:hypothetical protein
MYKRKKKMYSKRRSRLQNGAGFSALKKMADRLNKKYSKIAKATGADTLLKTTLKTNLPTIEQKLQSAGISDKIIKPLSGAINKQLGKGYGVNNEKIKYMSENPMGKEIYGTGWFDDVVSALAVLPIPGLSCVARTIAIVKTAVNTATSDDPVKAFGGVVSDIGNTITNVLPPGLKQIGEAGVGLAESVGFGAVSSEDRVKIVKVGVKHLGDILKTIDTSKLTKNKASQVQKAKKSVSDALPELNKIKVGGRSLGDMMASIACSKKVGKYYINGQCVNMPKINFSELIKMKSGGMIGQLSKDIIKEVKTFNEPRDNQSLTTTSKNQYRITNEADIIRELYLVGNDIDDWFNLNRSLMNYKDMKTYGIK